MAKEHAELAMMILGAASAILLVGYGLLAVGVTSETSLVFWAVTLAFLVYVGWDLRRHLRNVHGRSAEVGPRIR